MRMAVLFHRFGPYHHARLKAAGQRLEVTGIEMSAADDTYAWTPVAGADQFQRLTLFHERDVIHESTSEIIQRVHRTLDEVRPEVVAVPGWSDRGALAALLWCVRKGVPMVLMSETNDYDEHRVWWKEVVKKRVVGMFQAGLVGGRSHRDYLAWLGLNPDRIWLGYDVVDNGHFQRGAEAARAREGEMRQKLNLPGQYFLASSRFIAKKNLPLLFRAFARYRQAAGPQTWNLVILGDGELRPELERLRDELGLGAAIHMPGFKQYDELPAYYGLAGAFIHASTIEPWGLVVNEAMAAGLPVLVSGRCGCALELVEEGWNGYLFDPNDEAALCGHLLRMTNGEYDRPALGRASRDFIAFWSPETFAESLFQAGRAALQSPRPKSGPLEIITLHLLTGQWVNKPVPLCQPTR